MNWQRQAGELPDRYGKDYVQLMAVDPHNLYAYWEVSNRIRWLVAQHFECDWGVMPKVLRLYDVTGIYFNGGNANGFWDIETTPEASNWYIHGVRAGAVYLADYGTYTWNRQFIPLLRSLPAETARDSEAPWGAAIVPLVPELRERPESQMSRYPQHFFENFTYHSEYAKLL